MTRADEKLLPAARVHACGFYEVSCARRTRALRHRCIKSMLEDVARHELSESLYLDGRLYFDPHGEK